MTRTSIEWATDSWNPIAAYDRETGKRGWFCTKVSPGCTNCYAEQWNRFRGNGHLYRAGNLDKVRFELAPTLTDPLHWRKPRRVFVNSMTDLFLEQHTDEMIVEVFAVMAVSHYFGLPHEFLVLTKRPERMRSLLSSILFWNLVAIRTLDMLGEHGSAQLRERARKAMCEDDHGDYVIVREPRVDAPLPNVWLGVSTENQETADERIPFLLQTPAAIRFLSCEPLLGPIYQTRLRGEGNATWRDALSGRLHTHPGTLTGEPRIDWVIVGGESGAKARQLDAAWVHQMVVDCIVNEVPLFVKQMGSRPTTPDLTHWKAGRTLLPDGSGYALKLRNRKGNDPSEWPTELRVRQYPKEAACPA